MKEREREKRTMKNKEKRGEKRRKERNSRRTGPVDRPSTMTVGLVYTHS